jgi:hypothetical protein
MHAHALHAQAILPSVSHTLANRDVPNGRTAGLSEYCMFCLLQITGQGQLFLFTCFGYQGIVLHTPSPAQACRASQFNWPRRPVFIAVKG